MLMGGDTGFRGTTVQAPSYVQTLLGSRKQPYYKVDNFTPNDSCLGS